MNEWTYFCMNGHFQIGQINPIKFFLLIATTLGVAFALITPTEEQASWLHFLQWQLQVHFTIAIFIFSHVVFFDVLSKAMSPTFSIILTAFLSTLLITPLSLLLDIYFRGVEIWNTYYLMDEWFGVAPPSVLIWFMINAPWVKGLRINRESPTTSHNELKTTEVEKDDCLFPSFFSLTNISNVDELIALKSELHYLNVYTVNGEKLILYSLKQAIDELSNYQSKLADGQTHRSYWLNQHHLKSISIKGRQGKCIMSNNLVVPISRGHVQKTKTWHITPVQVAPCEVD